MKEYNDYVSTVRRWLKNYTKFKITLANLEDEIEAKTKELETDINAPIAKYSTEPGGGFAELNGIESAASKHEFIRAEIEEMKKSVESIKRCIRKIDRALTGLSAEDNRLITGYYIENMTWDELGREFAYTEKWARVHGSKAIREMAIMIFGPSAGGDSDMQLRFVFAC